MIKDDLMIKRVLKDLADNPHKKEEYRKILIQHGFLKNTTIRAKRVCAKELAEAEAQGITFILT